MSSELVGLSVWDAYKQRPYGQHWGCCFAAVSLYAHTSNILLIICSWRKLLKRAFIC